MLQGVQVALELAYHVGGRGPRRCGFQFEMRESRFGHEDTYEVSLMPEPRCRKPPARPRQLPPLHSPVPKLTAKPFCPFVSPKDPLPSLLARRQWSPHVPLRV